MNKKQSLIQLALLSLAIMYASLSLAADESVSSTSDPRLVNYSWMSLSRWYEMHAEDVALAAKGDSSLLFIGDSITEGWALEGKSYWNLHFEPLGAVNFGIGGDMTQNLLWRLDHVTAGALKPRAVVLLIGVNNLSFSRDTPETIGRGIIAVVDELEKHFPSADILLFTVLPAGEQATHPLRDRIKRINHTIAHLDDREHLTLLDISPTLLETDGSISSSVMPDYLHLSPEGYRRWTMSILPWIAERFAEE